MSKKNMDTWETKYDAVTTLMEEGVLLNITSDPSLYSWLHGQLHALKKQKLPGDKIKQVEKLGALLKEVKQKRPKRPAKPVKPRIFEKNFLALKDYIEKNGALPTRKNHQKLYEFLKYLKKKATGELISHPQQDLLNSIGVLLKKPGDELLEQFEELHRLQQQDALPPIFFRSYLQYLLQQQKYLQEQNKFSAEKAKQVAEMFDVTKALKHTSSKEHDTETGTEEILWMDKRFSKNFLNLALYAKKNGALPTRKDDGPLFNWVSELKQNKKRGLLHKQQEKLLGEIGLVWNKHNSSFNEHIDKIKELLNKGVVPNHTRDSELYDWLKWRQQQLKKQQLHGEKAKQVEEILTVIKELKAEQKKLGPVKRTPNS